MPSGSDPVPNISDAWHQDMLKALTRLQVQYETLDEKLDDLESELKQMKQATVDSRKWAVPVGISIITLLVLVISNTLTLVMR